MAASQILPHLAAQRLVRGPLQHLQPLLSCGEPLRSGAKRLGKLCPAAGASKRHAVATADDDALTRVRAIADEH